MKKVFLLSLFLFFNSCFVLADDTAVDNSNWGIQPQKQISQKPSAAEKTWNEEEYHLIYDDYGSDKSIYFLNRENMSPTENDDQDEDYESNN